MRSPIASLPDDVVLNVYELTPEPTPPTPTPSRANQSPSSLPPPAAAPAAEGGARPDSSTTADAPSSSAQQPSPTAARTFLSCCLRPLGLGAYHTSLDVQSYRYSFAAGAGIVKCQASDPRDDRYVPRNAAFKESIVLGRCDLSRGEINEIVNRLRHRFAEASYHLLNRNCNHFTETFALCLLRYDRLADDDDPPAVEKYPPWVNRLARTGTAMGVDHGDVCEVLKEAREASGAGGRVGWDLSSRGDRSSGPRDVRREATTGSKKKKELSDEQKALLAKIKQRKGRSR